MAATSRRKVRTTAWGCRVWLSPRRVTRFTEVLASIRSSRKTWKPATWARRVRSELRSKWGGCGHGGVRRAVGTSASAGGSELQACGESASGDEEYCCQRTDVSCTGRRVEPCSPNVSYVSCTGQASRHVSKSRSGREQPAALVNVNLVMSRDDLEIPTPALHKAGEFRMMEKLGEGSYGHVYRCIWRGRNLAVKIKKTLAIRTKRLQV